MKTVGVTVWNEYRHEKENGEIGRLYPDGIHGAIAKHLNSFAGIEAVTASLDEPEHGLTEKRLEQTDVLIWWGHKAHDEVKDVIVERVRRQILSGMGLIVLHSGANSKIFRTMTGTNCSFRWREIGERERIWNLAPDHPITQGIGEYFELERTEMYGERFDIPEPDRLVFVSWFEGGEVFRSGCCWNRGNGKMFYFRPGHETYPIFYDGTVLKVITNAVHWAAPLYRKDTSDCEHVKDPIETVGSGS